MLRICFISCAGLPGEIAKKSLSTSRRPSGLAGGVAAKIKPTPVRSVTLSFGLEAS